MYETYYNTWRLSVSVASGNYVLITNAFLLTSAIWCDCTVSLVPQWGSKTRLYVSSFLT
jgi:hypothetical protein